jgi:O-antigen ligase
MATTQSSHAPARQLARFVRPPAHTGLFAGLLLVMVFSVLTIWTLDRWAVTGTQIGIFALAMVAAFRATVRGTGWPRNWVQLPLWTAVIWGLAQLAANRSVYRFATWSAVLGWLTLAFAFGIAVQVFKDASLARLWRRFAIYFGAIIALWAILQLFSAEGKILWIYSPPESIRPMGPFLNRDYYSAFMELLLPLCLWEAMIDRPRAVLYGALAAIVYASVIAGASRAGSILVNLEAAAVLILALRRGDRMNWRNRRGVTLRIALLVMTFSAVVGWDVLLQRFETKNPFADRQEDWQAAIAMIHDRPWAGFGLGTWTTAYPGYAVFDAYAVVNAAHSDWLQWAGEGGIPFVALMLILAGRSLQLGIRSPWGLGAAFVFLHCSVDFPLQKPPIFLWLIVMVAALEAGRQEMHTAL